MAAASGSDRQATAPSTGTQSSSGRKIVIGVDDAEECERAVRWAMENLYRPGDEVHLAHIIPRLQTFSAYGAPPVDFLPQADPVSYEKLVQNAERFVAERFLPLMHGLQPEPVVHVIKSEVDTDSIGHVLCKKAEELRAAGLVVASHSKSKLQEFFLGSVTNYCTHHSRTPVIVVH